MNLGCRLNGLIHPILMQEGRGVANVFEAILKVLIRQDDEKRGAEADRGSLVVQQESETRCDIL